MTENQPLFLVILLPKFREESGVIQSQDVHLHLSPRQHLSKQRHLRTSADRHCLLLISVHSIIHVPSAGCGFRTRRAFQKVSQKSMTKEMSASSSSSSDQLGQIVSETVSDKQGRILCDGRSFLDRNFSSADQF